uniref:Guanine nucleotide-binding protein-like 1 n=1 Tax=Lygus hesperus TaxID=30085 RepID=A0A0K8ST48_LYGHE
MPHGRKKVPFSGKAKKLQLQAKKQTKSPWNDNDRRVKSILVAGSSDDDEYLEDNVQKLNQQPVRPNPTSKSNANRYLLQFKRESDAELRERKEQSRKTLVPLPETSLEVSSEQYFPDDLKFPVRPPWDFNMSKEQLDARENRYFTEYFKDIEKRYKSTELSFFELNLETWRQLWRVMEMLDIALVIVDIRFPSLMFPPYLFEYISNELKKSVILVLNKIDLVPAPLVVAWKHYLQERFPGIQIITFTSFPSYNLRDATNKKTGLNVRRCKGKMKMAAEGAQKLYAACKEIVGEEVDISSWHSKITEEMTLEYDEGDEVEIEETVTLKRQDTRFKGYNKFEGGVLTIGCIGQPNVGKSSLMNALMGKKVVSVSRTPGHTKHFQTIFLTPQVRLCDCPGLVFPSLVPKVLQAIMGSYPIAQLRDPYSSVKFVAERVDLVTLLKLEHPEHDDEWSAIDICDGWAYKKGFYTARTARLDTYRAANHLLRMILDGKISMHFAPPGYFEKKAFWEEHPEVQSVKWVQAVNQSGTGDQATPVLSEYESSDEGSNPAKDDRHPRNQSNSSSEGDEEDDEDSDDNLNSRNKFQVLNASIE